MKLDETRVKYPHTDDERVVNERDLNPFYDTRISIEHHIGKAGEVIELPPKVVTPFMLFVKTVIKTVLLLIIMALLGFGLFYRQQIVKFTSDLFNTTFNTLIDKEETEELPETSVKDAVSNPLRYGNMVIMLDEPFEKGRFTLNE